MFDLIEDAYGLSDFIDFTDVRNSLNSRLVLCGCRYIPHQATFGDGQ